MGGLFHADRMMVALVSIPTNSEEGSFSPGFVKLQVLCTRVYWGQLWPQLFMGGLLWRSLLLSMCAVQFPSLGPRPVKILLVLSTPVSCLLGC
jgi:hypothetical protein